MTSPLPAAADAPLHIGSVTIVARDVDAMTRFYEERLGLTVQSRGDGRVELGAGGAPLLTLRHDPKAIREPQGSAGLFHTAFLLPSRAALGLWLDNAIRTGLELEGASDHKVSEAIYLSDPEGNGIEVYADRPRSSWQRQGNEISMLTDPLNVRDLLASATGLAPSGRMPPGTLVGHVHLRVGEIETARAFYKDRIGLDIMATRPGALFLSSGGYHHHLGTNIWQSRGAGRRAEGMTGLESFELLTADNATFETLVSRLMPNGIAPGADRFAVEDPWGGQVVFRRG